MLEFSSDPELILGNWAAAIAGLHAHWLWRTLLIIFGMASYFGAVLVVGVGLVRYVGVPRNDTRRLAKLTIIPYLSAVFLVCAAGVLNPIGMQPVWQSALPATAGAQSGLLWLRYYIPKATAPERRSDSIERSYTWIGLAVASSLAYVFVSGRGIVLHR